MGCEVEISFFTPYVPLSKLVAMVCMNHHNCLIGLPGGVQRCKYLPDVVVSEAHRRIVCTTQLLLDGLVERLVWTLNLI